MKFKDVVSVSGMGGLFRVLKQRPDGMIIQSLVDDKSKFASNRIHAFSPLDKISIYVDTGDISSDSIGLQEVMLKMLNAENDEQLLPPNPKKASSQELKDYMGKVLSNYDRERVYVSDMKKLIKWYNLLKPHNVIDEPEEEETEEGENTETVEEAEAEIND